MKKLLIALAITMGVVSCDVKPYEAMSAEKGTVYVVNRFTGSVKEVNLGDTAGNKQKADPSIAAQPLEFNEIDIPSHDLRFSVSTIWNGESMDYRIVARRLLKVSSLIEKAENKVPATDWAQPLLTFDSKKQVTFIALDKFGFRITEIVLLSGSMTQIVDDQGALVMLNNFGVAKISAASYQRIANWTVTYSL